MSAPRLTRLLYHNVGNVRFDVGTIADLGTYKRLFCIFDRDKPYELVVKSYEPHTEDRAQPTFIDGKVGFTFQRSHELYKRSYFRVPSLADCHQHIREIRQKQAQLDQIEAHMREKTLRILELDPSETPVLREKLKLLQPPSTEV